MDSCNSQFGSCKFKKLNDFRKRDLFTDVTFIVGGENVRAHKNVLSARSEVFETMFTTSMTEAIHSIVNITDASKEAFEAFLEYLYTNAADYGVIEKHCSELLYLADKYLVAPLTRRCEEHLTANQETRSVVELLSLAESFNIPKLITRVISRIEGRGKEFLESTDFEQLVANFRFSKMVVSRMTPTTVTTTLDTTPEFWSEDCGDKLIEIRNNGNVVTVRLELRYARKTLYGYLEMIDDVHWNRPVEMTFKFTVSEADGRLVHSGQGDVWWESSYESDDDEWACGSPPERRRPLFEFCHKSETSIRNSKFIFSITLSQWVTPNRIFKKRKVRQPDREELQEVGPSKVQKVVPELSTYDQTSADSSKHSNFVFSEDEGNCAVGLDAITFKKLHQHVTFGSLPEESEVDASLILGAHRFSFTDLVEHCERVLASKVNEESAIETLILARKLDLKKLECTSLDFIDLHNKEVAASKGWQELEGYPELVAAILKKILTKPPPFKPISETPHPRISLPPLPTHHCGCNCDSNSYCDRQYDTISVFESD